MTDIATGRGSPTDDDNAVDDPGGRLGAYEASTQTPLDLLALATLWLVVVPPGDFGGHDTWLLVLIIRLALSGVYAIDLTIRGVLAGRPVRYALRHPIALAAVIVPAVRVIFSIRLVRSMFRRGNLGRFLIAAVLMVANGALIVWLYERHAPGANIHSLGQSLWWSVVTVTTVGYGDYYPVTAPGEITACVIMAIGLLTLAVLTAQVASSFVAQGSSRAVRAPRPEEAAGEVTLAELDRRLARIEELMIQLASGPRPAS